MNSQSPASYAASSSSSSAASSSSSSAALSSSAIANVSFSIGDAPQFFMKNKIAERIGQGSYSVVYKSVNIDDNHDYLAVKIFPKDKVRVDNLIHEVEILREVNHPNIMKFYGFYQDQDNFFLVTELLAGGELYKRIVDKIYFSEREAQYVMQSLGNGVKYLHDNNIVHRDLKPENILYTSHEENAGIKIADFGFSMKVGAKGLTTKMGTPWYVAPEMLKEVTYSFSVDMWALGVILYILLCGYPPFHDESLDKLFEKIKACDFNMDDAHWNNISDSAKDLIMHLIVLNPDERYKIQDLLNHPWMKTEFSSKDTPGLGEIRQYMDTRNLKNGNHARHAMARMKLIAINTTPSTIETMSLTDKAPGAKTDSKANELASASVTAAINMLKESKTSKE